MNKKVLLLTIAGLLFAAIPATAQDYVAVDDQGKEVKRVIFDREKVTIEYRDAQVRTDVQEALIVRQSSFSSVQDIKSTDNGKRQIYDLQGRPVENLDMMSGGIFIVREGDKVYKLIKK